MSPSARPRPAHRDGHAPAAPLAQASSPRSLDRAAALTFRALLAAHYSSAALPFPVGFRLAGRLGSLGYFCAPGARRRVVANLQQALGHRDDARLRRVALGCFRHWGHSFYELASLPHLSRADFERRVTVVGLEQLVAARDRGAGIILATAHLGAFDLTAQIALAHGVRLAALVEPLADSRLRQLTARLRASHGVDLLPLGPAALRQAYRHLAASGALALAVDRQVSNGGEVVPFFGRPARLPEAAAELALRTGAAILPTFATRGAAVTYEVRLEPAVAPVPGDVPATMRRVLAVVERAIRRQPDQWLCFNRIWH